MVAKPPIEFFKYATTRYIGKGVLMYTYFKKMSNKIIVASHNYFCLGLYIRLWTKVTIASEQDTHCIWETV